MYPMTITLHNEDQLRAVMGALTTGRGTPEKKPDAAKQEGTAPTPPTAAQAAAPEPRAESSAPDAKQPPAGEQRTIDEAKKLTMKIVEAKGRNAAVELLTKYSVPVAAKLKPEQIAGFCNDAEKVLAS